MDVQTINIPFDEQLLPVRRFTAGKLSCMYEDGRLRYLKYGETEVIRMIYFAVRDKDWKTALYTIEKEYVETNENGFSVSYTSIHKLDEITYCSDVIIRAENNTISFSAKGEALSSFKRNRIGICVHHPVRECSGKKVIISSPDGTEYTARFPDLISPHQPFREIKKIKCEISKSVTAELIFEGDTFETEDQRNWADSSYKTYSTPLDIPIPVMVNKGDIVEQKLELHITGEETEKDEKSITQQERKIPFPKIGYELKNGEQLNQDEISLLRQITFDHYRAELWFLNADWQEKLQERFGEVRKLNTKLELILFFSDDFKDQLSRFFTAITDNAFMIDSVLVLHTHHIITPKHVLDIVYGEIKKIFPHIKVGYGTDGFFAELNRNRPACDKFDFVSFSLSPQVHASDSRSLIENLERQSDIIQTASSFGPGKEIHISPITFKIRASADETSKMPSDYDLRLHRSIGALWTLHSIKNLAGASRLTFYQVKGYRGIINDRKQFTEQSPLCRILKTIKIFNPKWIIDTGCNQQSPSGKIALENEEGKRLEFVMNMEMVDT